MGRGSHPLILRGKLGRMRVGTACLLIFCCASFAVPLRGLVEQLPTPGRPRRAGWEAGGHVSSAVRSNLQLSSVHQPPQLRGGGGDEEEDEDGDEEWTGEMPDWDDGRELPEAVLREKNRLDKILDRNKDTEYPEIRQPPPPCVLRPEHFRSSFLEVSLSACSPLM